MTQVDIQQAVESIWALFRETVVLYFYCLGISDRNIELITIHE